LDLLAQVRGKTYSRVGLDGERLFLLLRLLVAASLGFDLVDEGCHWMYVCKGKSVVDRAYIGD